MVSDTFTWNNVLNLAVWKQTLKFCQRFCEMQSDFALRWEIKSNHLIEYEYIHILVHICILFSFHEVVFIIVCC